MMSASLPYVVDKLTPVPEGGALSRLMKGLAAGQVGKNNSEETSEGGCALLALCFQRRLFFAQNDFAMANELVVQPEAVLVRRRFASGARRTAEQAHPRGGLKNIRRKGAAVHIEFDAQIACVGDPGNLVAFIDHDDLRDESNEYGAFSHFLWPALFRADSP